MSWEEIILIAPLTSLDEAPFDIYFTAVPSARSLLVNVEITHLFSSLRNFLWSADYDSDSIKKKKKVRAQVRLKKTALFVLKFTQLNFNYYNQLAISS